ncbi:IS1634 family transposase [Pseudonocardia sp. N23]|uniref:IS1634 family transposase n=1 Tax=Pseudonocardia sp. N23 TaxID=1987376 RepID=UPI000C032A91|nr:IS1634 family transposase [Pseudonocardia sp. N23]GAY09464.1 mobile element protein [Pseudonocardia sp. N23]
MAYVRKVKTASGATAVQIVEKRHGVRRIVAHIGSAHDDAALAVLVASARDRIHAGQQALDLPAAERASAGGATVTGSASEVLWQVLTDAYRQLGFDTVADEAFRALVLARIVEPTSTQAAVGVLDELGVAAPHRNTFTAALRRCIAQDYRAVLASACATHSVRTRSASPILYDVTTLHFEAEHEDKLRKVGMSKERRVDPQIQVGLLVDPSGFPLEVSCFEGNTAETSTLLPVLRGFKARHEVEDMVVVADAGMLSAKNLNALEDEKFSFIVGSRISRAPYDLAEHFERHGNAFTDGQHLESTRVMGTGKAARSRRVVYHYLFARHKRDDRAINAMVDRAEKVAAGKRPLKKDRFVRLDSGDAEVDWGLVERARQLAGLKGYVTNLPKSTMDGAAVVEAYHDLWQVEKSFRMAKSDLRARPIFHRQRDAIEAHLTVVFAALAVSRHLQEATGASIRKLVRTLKPLRTVRVDVGGHPITATPQIVGDARVLLDRLPAINAPGH